MRMYMNSNASLEESRAFWEWNVSQLSSEGFWRHGDEKGQAFEAVELRRGDREQAGDSHHFMLPVHWQIPNTMLRQSKVMQQTKRCGIREKKIRRQKARQPALSPRRSDRGGWLRKTLCFEGFYFSRGESNPRPLSVGVPPVSLLPKPLDHRCGLLIGRRR